MIPDTLETDAPFCRSEELFGRLFESAPEAMLVLDKQGQIVLANALCRELTGYEEHELLSRPFEIIVPGSSMPAKSHKKNGSLKDTVNQARHKNGSVFLIEIKSKVLTAGSRLRCLSLRALDDPRAKQADRMLLEKEAWLNQGQAIAHLGSFYWDVRANVITWSDELYRIYGLEPTQQPINFERYLGRVHPGYRDQVMKAVQSAIQQGNPFEHEYQIVRPIGEVRWVFARGEPVKNAQGQLIALQGICHDITERKQNEEALRESQARYQAVIESTADGIFINKSGRIVYANPALLRILGANSPEQVIGKSPYDIIHPDFHRFVRERIRTILQTQQPVPFMEERYIRMDGTTVDVEIAASPFQDQGETAILVTSRDLAERKRIETALRQERDRFTQVAAISPGAIHSFRRNRDRTVSFPYASAGIENIYGLSPESLVQDAAPLRELIHPDDLDTLRQALDESANSLTNFTCEFRVNHPTKGEIWVEGRSTPTRQPDGSVLWHGVLTDVTDRKHAQEELEKERTLLRTLLDTLPDIIFTKDTAGRLVMGNKAHLALFGVTNEEDVAGTTVFDLHPRHLAEGYHTDDMLVLQQGQAVVNREELIRGADGREEWYLVIKVPLRDREGKITGLVGLCRNIQERKAVMESLRASNELFHFVSLATHDAIYDWQIEKGIIWRNENYQKLFSPNKLLGQDDQWWQDHIHPDDRARVIDSMELALHTRSSYWTGEYRFQRSDGTFANVMDRGYIFFSPEGKPIRMIGAMSDISESKLLEGQLLQAQKMEAVGQLAGGVAHDFNNLLTTVLGYSELLLSDLSADDPRRFAIEEIKKSGTRAAALTQQLLAFSRKQMLQPQILDLNVIVGDITKMLRRLIGENIRLQLRCQDHLWPVKADPHQLQQVIVNLVVNARDAMPAGGDITIGTENVEIDDDYVRSHVGATIGSHVQLTVVDTGVGMTEEVKKRIFEPFFTTKGLGKGTGLGLATVYGIVKQSGGYICVDSSPGTGSTFTILLPRVPTSQYSGDTGRWLEKGQIAGYSRPIIDRSVDASPVPVGTETILLVEDEDGVRDLAQLSLGTCGYQVLSANSGEEALALAASHPGKIHLLFTDLLMPGMSGTELAAKLLAAQPNIKILYMSGYTEDVVSRHPIGLAGPSLLQKPFSHRVLADRVREVLDSKVNFIGLKQ